MVIQARHWSYCEHVTERNKRHVPEFKATIDEFSEGKWSRSHSVSKVLALSVPALFACTWIVFFIWLLVRPGTVEPSETIISLDRVLLAALVVEGCWLWIRVRKMERHLSGKIKVAALEQQGRRVDSTSEPKVNDGP